MQGDTLHLSRDKNHHFVGVFDGPLENLDHSVDSFEMMTLEALDRRISEMPEDFTKSFFLQYEALHEELYAFRDQLQILSEKYTSHVKSESQSN